jgi:transcriptional regulator with XRE-family HTH domain
VTLPLETDTQETTASSRLAATRLRRGLSVEEAAHRSGLGPEEVRWLEDGRLYRFASSDEAIAAAILYASALGIDVAEARELAGLPPQTAGSDRGRARRIAVLVALVAAVGALAAAIFLTGTGRRDSRGAAPSRPATALPPPWKVRVDVLNGAGDINWTRRVASRVGALGYRIGRVARANRFDYPRTAVYYEPGGQALAIRLARTLKTATAPLPGGSNPRRLVVIVGPHRGPA